MSVRLLRCVCPYCSFLVVEVATMSTLLVCPRCGHTFPPSRQSHVGFWVLGALVLLVANLCVMILR
jgi:hypothetical protein